MKKLIQKLISNTISKEEYEELMELLKENKHSEEVKNMMDEYWYNLNDSDHDSKYEHDVKTKDIYSKINDYIQREKYTPNNRKKTIQILYKIAAIFIIGASLLFIYKETSFTSPISVDDNSITLTHENGNIEIIQENGERQITNQKGNVIGVQVGGQLLYKNEDVQNGTGELVYNTLTVPYGKRFDLTLADGSQVMLNAGSSLKYPIQFIKGQNRKVYLTGEAYFDIAKDKAHPFVVNTNDVDIQVLGTEFNVSFYPEDLFINTVLVEGSVQLTSMDDSPIIITPGQMAQWDKASKSMSVTKVDIDLYTAWKDGILLFRKTPFSNIRKKLERYFDITIENNNLHLEEQTYTASFTYESLHDILETFKEDTPFEYEVLDEKIKIKPFNPTTK